MQFSNIFYYSLMLPFAIFSYKKYYLGVPIIKAKDTLYLRERVKVIIYTRKEDSSGNICNKI